MRSNELDDDAEAILLTRMLVDMVARQDCTVVNFNNLPTEIH